MACDLQGTLGDSQILTLPTKIYKFKPHERTYPNSEFIMGFAGTAGDAITMADFFENPDTYDEVPEPEQPIQGMVLTPDGRIYHMTGPTKWVRIMDAYFSIGSGSSVALGAMAMGATPKQAVKAAIKVDPFSGQGIKSLKFK